MLVSTPQTSVANVIRVTGGRHDQISESLSEPAFGR